MRRHTRGFTLVEVLVTLFVFGILSVVTIGILNQALLLKDQINTSDAAVREVQLSHAILKADLGQLVMRAVRDSSGNTEPFVFEGRDGSNSGAVLKFVRDGWQNPADYSPRSSLQRVHYVFEDGLLMRRAFSRLDDGFERSSFDRVLLSDVEALKIAFYFDGQWRDSWAVPAQGSGVFPNAIAFDVRSRALGDVRQVFLTAGSTL